MAIDLEQTLATAQQPENSGDDDLTSLLEDDTTVETDALEGDLNAALDAAAGDDDTPQPPEGEPETPPAPDGEHADEWADARHKPGEAPPYVPQPGDLTDEECDAILEGIDTSDPRAWIRVQDRLSRRRGREAAIAERQSTPAFTRAAQEAGYSEAVLREFAPELAEVVDLIDAPLRGTKTGAGALMAAAIERRITNGANAAKVHKLVGNLIEPSPERRTPPPASTPSPAVGGRSAPRTQPVRSPDELYARLMGLDDRAIRRYKEER